MVEPSLEWSGLTADDVDDVESLIEACAWFDDPVDRTSAKELREELTHPWFEPGRNGVVGRDRSGSVLAAGWLLFRHDADDNPRVWLDSYVHPQSRHRQIGLRLVTWLTERAIEWGTEREVTSLWLGCYSDAKLGLRRANLTDAGFIPERWFADMHLSFDEVDPATIPDPELGDVRIVSFDPAHSEAVRVAHNRAFAALPGALPQSSEDWEHSLRAASTRPEWSFVAFDGDEVVGYALSSAYQQDWDAQGTTEGWTDRIGVLPTHRGRQIGQALLKAVLVSFADAGLDGAGLGVDVGGQGAAEQASSALRLFSRLGYQEADTVVLYGLRCRYHDGVLRRVEGDQ